MITYNPQKQENCKVFTFPDGQPHVQLTNFKLNYSTRVVCTIKNPNELFILQLLINALDNNNISKDELFINYLMGARFDRIMQLGDSLDLKVVTDTINRFNFKKVYIFEPHSDATLFGIERSQAMNNYILLEKFNNIRNKEEVVLIVPDAGATKKIKSITNVLNVVDIVQCIKTRDLSNGEITLKVLEPEKCKNKSCVIVDDLCDGGGTFLAISNQIEPSHLTLIVSHGVFSRGLIALEMKFDLIITSNSYCQLEETGILKIVNI